MQEQVDRGDPLAHTGFNLLLVLYREHPRNDVERQDTVDGIAVSIDRKRDAEIKEFTPRVSRPAAQRRQVKPFQPLANALGVPQATPPDHLAIVFLWVVTL